MLINLESTRYYRGLGDLVMWAWLAEGAKAGNVPLEFHRTSNRDLTAMLGMSVTDEPGGESLDDVYEFEKRERCTRPRVDYIRQYLGLATGVARPVLRLSEADEQWANEVVEESDDPLVLLFPQTAWKTREWPANYWVDLAWKLKRQGVRTIVMLQGKDERFENTPSFRWNTPLSRVAALMLRASLIVGNGGIL